MHVMNFFLGTIHTNEVWINKILTFEIIVREFTRQYLCVQFKGNLKFASSANIPQKMLLECEI